MPPAGALPDNQIDLIVQWIAGGATAEVTAGEPQSGGGGDIGDYTWTKDVQPILQASCAACHGSSGGWYAGTYSSTINSGDSGPAVVPGNADDSSMIQRLLGNGNLMPPGAPLSEEQIAILIYWVNSGAKE